MKVTVCLTSLLVAVVFLAPGAPPALAKLDFSKAQAGKEFKPLKRRIPGPAKKEAKKLKTDLYEKSSKASAEIIAEGKQLYENKGTCKNCHGEKGDGKGPGGAMLKPGPRDFTNCKFHRKRKDYELRWIIGNGSEGTGMQPLAPPKAKTITDEEAWKIIAYERSFCNK